MTDVSGLGPFDRAVAKLKEAVNHNPAERTFLDVQETAAVLEKLQAQQAAAKSR
jgi:hypothetical protein